MKKWIWKRLVSMALMFAVLLSSAPMSALGAGGNEEIEEGIVVDDTVTSGSHYFTYTAAQDPNGVNGWASDVKNSILGDANAKSQHWVWNENYAEAAKHTYMFTFKGTGVELWGVKNDSQNTFQIDSKTPQTVSIEGGANQPVMLYSQKELNFGEHVVKATLPAGGTGLQVCFAKVLGADSGENMTSALKGIIVDTNTKYTQNRYVELLEKSMMSKKLTAWKNDKAVSELALISKGGTLKNVTVTAGSLSDGSHVIPAEQVKTVFIKSTKAYNGAYLGYGDPNRPLPEATQTNRSEASDILYQTEPIDIGFNRVQPVWLEFAVPNDQPSGTYTGVVTVSADGIEKPLSFQYELEVQDAQLPDAAEFKDGFDIELWQYPYSSAEYYGVEPFSAEHLKLMESSMLKYKEVGGDAITVSIVEDAWSGQTYSANEVHYPSMIKWTKNSNGSFSYDYTHFDKWVEFNEKLGIGDKIVLYSIAPWHNSFTYWENGTLKYEKFTVGSDRYKQVWSDFLQKLIEHLMDKGWFEQSYIGIDERGFHSSAFDLIDSVKNIHGQSLKTAGAMDGFINNKALAMRVTDLNVGDNAAQAHAAEFAQLLQDRKAKGLRTTLYSCTEHQPGNFALSAPVESYWSVVNAGKMGTAGFMRWAYDAWVADPLTDTTHNAFEPGDCFLIYPDHKDSSAAVSKSSVRLEKMAEGVRDLNKLILMEEEIPSLKQDIDALYASLKTLAITSRNYMSKDKVTVLSEEMDNFKEGVARISRTYISRKESGTNQVDFVSIEEGENLEMALGKTQQLHAAIRPENILDNRINWSSSNAAVVSVSEQGVLTAHRLGNAVITAASRLDASKKAEISVTVKAVWIEESAKVSYYSFDRMENDIVTDEWGIREGVNQGATLTQGKSGKALAVAEAKKSVRLNGELEIGNNWTVGYWIYNTTKSAVRNSALMSRNGNYSFDLRMAADRENAGVHVGTGGGDVLTFQYKFPTDTWIHVAWTQDKVKGLSMYINGSLIQTNNWTVSHNFTCPMDIVGADGFTGKIDELKVFNRVLAAEEIASVMQTMGLNLQENRKELYTGDTYDIQTNLISDQEDKTITYLSSDPEIAAVDQNGRVTAKKRGTAVITVENKAAGFRDTVTIVITKRLNISNKLTVYPLDQEKLSVIDKDQGGPRQYLGQPDMVMLDDNKTLVTAYPIGHGKGQLVLKISYDGGETWVEKKTPESWKGSQETPTIYKLHLKDNTQRLMLITACPGWGTDSAGNSTGWNTSYSDDGGETWTEYQHWYTRRADGTENKSIVAMASLIQLKDSSGNYIQKWMGVYHDYGYVNYKTYLTFDENGKEQWSEPEPYLKEYRSIENSYQICEVGMFRSPDESRIVGLCRSQSHNNPATLIYSDDEGETWSKPMDLPGSLAGERHKAVYDPVSGRLLITFREIIYDLNQNNKFDGANDWLAGDWVAWVGTYEDLMEQNEGQYRILIAEDWANNAKSGDTGYAGLVVQPDGTFIMNSYGHWDKDFSLSWTGGVTTDLCYIKQAKFKLTDVRPEPKPVNKVLLRKTIEAAEKIIVQGDYTDVSWKAFQEALQAAKAVYLSDKSVQEAVNLAAKNLMEAQASLQKKPVQQPVKLPIPAISKIKVKNYNKLEITWNEVSGAAGYDIYYATKRNGAYKKKISLKGGSKTSYVAGGLISGKQYYFKVRACASNDGKQLDSEFSNAKAGRAIPLKTNITSVKNYSGKKLRVIWKRVEGASGYEIRYSFKKKGSYKRFELIKKGKTTACKRGKLAKNKTYYFKVRAYRRVGKTKVYGNYSDIRYGKVKK